MSEQGVVSHRLAGVEILMAFEHYVDSIGFGVYNELKRNLEEQGFELRFSPDREIGAQLLNPQVQTDFGSFLAIKDQFVLRIQPELMKFSWQGSVEKEYPGFNAILEQLRFALDGTSRSLMSKPFPLRALNVQYRNFVESVNGSSVSSILNDSFVCGTLREYGNAHQMLLRWRMASGIDRAVNLEQAEIVFNSPQHGSGREKGHMLSLISGKLANDADVETITGWISELHEDVTQLLRECVKEGLVSKWISK